MTRRREPPDTKIVPFPDNWRGDASAGAHLASWGPGNDILSLRACNIVLIEKDQMICGFTLHVVLQGIGFYLHNCRLVKWGRSGGQRAMLPERARTTATGRSYYSDIITFDRNITAKEFEQASLRAIRVALVEFRERQAQAAPAPSAAEPVDDGVARSDDLDAVPF